MPPKTPGTWTPDEIREWIDRHGGNKSRLAKRLEIARSTLNASLTDPSRSWYRPLSTEVIAHMRTIDLHES